MKTMEQQSPTRNQGRFRSIYNRFFSLPIDEEEAEPAIEQMPTVRMQAVQATQSRLPLDAEGRLFLQACEPGTPTHVLVERCVSLFFEISGSYPEIIVLNKERWAFTGEPLQYYVPEVGRERKIPYGYEGEQGYDLLVRGRNTRLA